MGRCWRVLVLVVLVSYATDCKGTGSSSTTILTYPNVHPPEVGNYKRNIVEGEREFVPPLYVKAIDLDVNAVLLYSIHSQTPGNFWQIEPMTGRIFVNKPNNEGIRFTDGHGGKFVLVVKVTDGIYDAFFKVKIAVIDINDNVPVFSSSFYEISINETTPPETSIFQVTATDADDPTSGSGTLKYTILSGNTGGKFLLDEDTGVLSSSPDGTFDYDKENRYVLQVVAKDLGQPQLSGSATVAVNILDNDNREPLIVQFFKGEIFVQSKEGAVLDRESNPRMSKHVIARGNRNGPAENPNQREATVQVNLADEDENCPRFTKTEYRVTISETITVGNDIIHIFFTDRDIGSNAGIIYSKVFGSGTDYEDFFDVRNETGYVYVKKSLNTHSGIYQFYVEATVNFGTGCTTNTSVVVTVNPSKNAPPIWVVPPVDNTTFYVLEEQYKGMLVHDVFARDDDSGANGVVDYSFIYHDEQVQATPEFKINKLTGEIRTEVVFDREKVDKYVLLLRARDRDEPALDTTRFLTVTILDVNDNKPVFPDHYIDTEFKVNIRKDQPLGDIVHIRSATDPDLNPVIVYSIISGNEDDVFELDRNSRMLRLLKPLDRERKRIYYIDVLASNDEPDYTVIQNRRRKRAVDQSILTVKIVVGDTNVDDDQSR